MPFNSLAYIHTREDQLACLRAARAHLAPGGAFAFDVLAPRLDFLAEALHAFPALRVDADFAVPLPGVERFVRSCVDRYEPATQTLNSTFHLRHPPHRRRTERLVRDLAWHMYFPAELEGLLEVAGLEPLSATAAGTASRWTPGRGATSSSAARCEVAARPRAAAIHHRRWRVGRRSRRAPMRGGWPRGP